MSKFKELQAAYTEWTDKGYAHARESRRFPLLLARQFASYVGAPETYTDPSTDQKVPYVAVMEAVRDAHGQISYRAKPGARTLADVAWDDDGYCYTAITLTVDRAANTFPKMPFAFPLRFALSGTSCKIQVVSHDDTRITADTADWTTFHPVFDAMVRILRDALAQPPDVTRERFPIGFVHHREAE